MKHIINLGEALIDIIPSSQIRLGELCYSPHPGGAVANVAVAIARLGGSSRFIGGGSEKEVWRPLGSGLAQNHRYHRHAPCGKDAPTPRAPVTLYNYGD